ncbi:THUMP domain-containing protein 1 [Stigmatopora argus]
MSAEQNESRKRGKKYFLTPQQHAKRLRASKELAVGMQGILITCNMNQDKCTAEAFDLLGEYADKIYGPEKFEEDIQGGNGEEENPQEEDVEDALKKEVAHLRAADGVLERRFQALESGANNVVFIRTHNLETDRLVHHILSDLHATKKKKTRVILRMLPVTGTCYAFPDEIMKYLNTFLEPWFKMPNYATYQVAFKARNNSYNKRDDMIKAVAGLVGKMNPRNRVNLTHPDLTIILEVIRTVCCVSVVREYKRYKKYNLQEVVKTEGGEDEPPSKAEDDEKEAGKKREGDEKEAGDKQEDGEKEAAKKKEGGEMEVSTGEEGGEKEKEAATEQEGGEKEVVGGGDDDVEAGKPEEGCTTTKEAEAAEEEGASVSDTAAGGDDEKPPEEDMQEEAAKDENGIKVEGE